MKKNSKIISFAACALVLTASLAVKPAMAYFTDYTSAEGRVAIEIEDTHSSITESGSGLIKNIVVENTNDVLCYVRVAVILPEHIKLDSYTGDGWQEQDGYFYYDTILDVADDASDTDSSSELKLVIDTAGAIADGEDDYQGFNVIVIPESVKVLYDADGNPYADWSQKATVSEEGEA